MGHIEGLPAPFPVLQSLCGFPKSSGHTHNLVRTRVARSVSGSPRFSRPQEPRHGAAGELQVCLHRPYAARPRLQAQAPRSTFPPCLSLPLCVLARPLPLSSLPSLCVPSSPCGDSLSLPLCFFPSCPHLPLSLPLSPTLPGPPFARWCAAMLHVSREAPSGHRRPREGTGLEADTQAHTAVRVGRSTSSHPKH